MDFYTHISYSKPLFRLSYSNKIMLLGSCFVENIGKRLEKYKFDTDINPFGTLYNPFSIATAINRLIEQKEYAVSDLIEADGTYHSYDHHSRFSGSCRESVITHINDRLHNSALFFSKCNYLLVTFGTAWVYSLRENGKIVANCHKMPERLFERKRVTPEQITETWTDLLKNILQTNSNIKVLFTVSPIRHWKDGAHGNQLSKSALLIAIDNLCSLFPGVCDYFPSYEIMMDELRDYRFYAEDMIHPSETATDYIWERFVETIISDDSRDTMKTCLEISKAVEHRPFNPDSESYKRFIFQTLLKIDRLNDKFPFFDFSKERNYLNSKLKE